MSEDSYTVRKTTPELIAPCGINCRLCRAYGRAHKPCPGCRADVDNSCANCRIRKNCVNLAEGKLQYCFECGDFPCAPLAHLDWRYRTRYGVDVLGNLARIHLAGIQSFVEDENRRWACPHCGAMLCMHKPQCPTCGYAWRT